MIIKKKSKNLLGSTNLVCNYWVFKFKWIFIFNLISLNLNSTKRGSLIYNFYVYIKNQEKKKTLI